jgi:hypothetical protein
LNIRDEDENIGQQAGRSGIIFCLLFPWRLFNLSAIGGSTGGRQGPKKASGLRCFFKLDNASS